MSLLDRIRDLRAMPGGQEVAADPAGQDVQGRPEIAAPECPTWLGHRARKRWGPLVDQLARMGILTRMDQHVIGRYIELTIEWEELAELVRRGGHTQLSSRGRLEISAAATARQRVGSELATLERELGLTPSARARMLYASYGGRPLAAPRERPVRSPGRRGAYRRKLAPPAGGDAS